MEDKNNKIIEAARDLLKSFGYFVDNLWHVEDIHFICEQNNIARMGDEEAMEVFAIAKERFDGENGLSWPALEKAVHIYMHRKAVLNVMCDSSPV